MPNCNDTYFIYKSKGFPLGKLSVNLNIENSFYEEVFINQFELILGNRQIQTKIPFDNKKIGQ
jgi:hypothetical protein